MIEVDQQGNVTGKLARDAVGGIIFPRTKINVRTLKTGSNSSITAQCEVDMISTVKELSLS